MIAIVDYGAGNLGSVHKAFAFLGAHVSITADPAVICRADALVLPGVGAFSHCMDSIDRLNLRDCIVHFAAQGRPFLGICLGLQMLFEGSDEPGSTRGFGLLKGRVKRFTSGLQNEVGAVLKVPHVGWNTVNPKPGAALFHGLSQTDRVYFVHSYYPDPADSSAISATADYGEQFCCAIQQGNLHATQFHPEKSGDVGLTILRNFERLAA